MKEHFNQINPTALSTLEDVDNHPSINRIDAFSVNQKALFNVLLRYRFSTLSVSSSDALKTYMGSDMGIQGAKFILSNTHKTIKNIRDIDINTLYEIYDFVKSFDQIIDRVSNCIKVDGIFIKLFKKAKLFDFCLGDLKQVEKLNAKSLNRCVENQLNNLQSMVIYFWANDNFLKLKNCGQKSNLELTELCRKHELTLRKSIVSLLGEKPNQSFIQKLTDYSVRQKSLFNNILQYRFSKLSAKSSHALNGYLQSDINIQGVIFILCHPESELRNIRNVGV